MQSGASGVHEDGLLDWVLAGIAVIATTLCGVITVMWRVIEGKNAKAIRRLEDTIKDLTAKHEHCEKARLESLATHVRMETQYQYLTEELSRLRGQMGE